LIVAIECTPAKNYVLKMGLFLNCNARTLVSIEAEKSFLEIPEFVNLAIASKLFPKPKTILTFSLIDG
jgi:hypothetical protein